jgi:hypothetical protein
MKLTLPKCTFPRRLQDTPAYHNWPGENLEVIYGEGLFIGYRHYDRVNLAPLFPFGHGLSYTTFEYGRPSLSSRVLDPNTNGGLIELVVAVSNVGEIKGLETVQIYVRDEKSKLPRPEKELVAFEKVELEAGETKHLRIAIDKYAVGYYDTARGAWVAEEGRFRVLVAASAADVKYVVLLPELFGVLLLLGVSVLTLFAGMMSRLRLRRLLLGCSKLVGGALGQSGLMRVGFHCLFHCILFKAVHIWLSEAFGPGREFLLFGDFGPQGFHLKTLARIYPPTIG